MPLLHHNGMIRTQIQFEKEQYEALRRIAHRKRISLSEAVRQAVDNGLGRHRREETGAKALLSLAGIGESGLGDLGRAHDHYLDDDNDESAPKL